jgi:DNA repair exonuclease SbcCD ATPase subunit
MSKAESSETVIHGASIGAGDDEPVIVARVVTTRADDTAGADAEHGQSEEARQQAERLRELWLSLVEREQRLELRLQELQVLREQEAAERELESRVAAADMEARMLALKASSLEEENGRLRARLEELDDARAELERAKEKLRAIEALVRGEREEAALQARVEELERGGEEVAAALRDANAALEEENMELALRLRDAEQVAAEAAALREANAALEVENMERSLRLRDAEQVASSVRLAVEVITGCPILAFRSNLFGGLLQH